MIERMKDFYILDGAEDVDGKRICKYPRKEHSQGVYV